MTHTEAGLREGVERVRDWARREWAEYGDAYNDPAATADDRRDAGILARKHKAFADRLDSLLRDTPEEAGRMEWRCPQCWKQSPRKVGETRAYCYGGTEPHVRTQMLVWDRPSSTPEGEKRCGGSGYLRKRPSAANGLTSYPCPGCGDCRPCRACGLPFTGTCPRCHGTGVEPAQSPDLHTGERDPIIASGKGYSREDLQRGSIKPPSQHPEQSEEPRRWTIYVCPGCGNVEDEPGLCSDRPAHRIFPETRWPELQPVEVVEAASYERVKAERDEARAVLALANTKAKGGTLATQLIETAERERDEESALRDEAEGQAQVLRDQIAYEVIPERERLRSGNTALRERVEELTERLRKYEDVDDG